MNSNKSSENWEIEDLHLTQKFPNLNVQIPNNFSREDQPIPPNFFSQPVSIDSFRKERKSLYFHSATMRSASRSDRVKKNKINDSARPSQFKKKETSRFFQVMIRFFLVKKFIRSLRDNTIYRNPKFLKENDFYLINDWVYYPFRVKVSNMKKFLKINSKNFFGKSTKLICRLLQISVIKPFQRIFRKYSEMNLQVFHPTDNIRLIWDFLQMILTLICMIVIPVEICFEINFFKHWLGISLNPLYIVLFSLDILMNFNTGYYLKGELVLSRDKICKNYMNSGLVFDCISLIYFLLKAIFKEVIALNYLKFSGLLFALRIKNLLKVESRFEEYLFTDEVADNIISFVRLILGILLFSHFCACVWLLIGKFEYPDGWITHYDLLEESIFAQYINSLYFVVVVINTVGFGDFIPQTNFEKLFTTCFIFVACMIFGYSLNKIGVILNNINKAESELKRELSLINGFMKHKDINFDLKIKVRNYLEYISQIEKIQNDKETQNIINKLSKSLKEELLLHANGILLKKLPIFNKNFSPLSLQKIVYQMKQINLTPNDIIFHENDFKENNLYIVIDGEIEIYIASKKSQTIKLLQKGDYFGEYSFFTDMAHEFSARSASFSSLFVIKKETFLNILKENPEDYEKFCRIKDEINLYKEFNSLYRYCDSCKNPNHTVLACPQLHLNLSVDRVLEKYNFSMPQERNWCKRKRNKINSRRNFSIIQKKGYEIYKELAVAENILDSDSKHTSKSEYYEDYEYEISRNSDPSKNMEEYTYSKDSSSDPILKKTPLSSDSSYKNYDQRQTSLERRFKKEEEEEKTVLTNENVTKKEPLNIIEKNAVEIDQVFSYQCYFPQNNIEYFVEKINSIVIKKQRKLKNVLNFYLLMKSNKEKKENKFANFNNCLLAKNQRNLFLEKFFKAESKKSKENLGFYSMKIKRNPKKIKKAYASLIKSSNCLKKLKSCFAKLYICLIRKHYKK